MWAALRGRTGSTTALRRAISWGRGILVAIPLCIAAQLAPIPLSWAHPIWASAHDVLGGLSLGPITADIGLTVDALVLVLAALSLLGIAILVVRNRSRAELVLFVLSGVTAVAALMLDLHRLSPALATAAPSDFVTTLAGLGLMLSVGSVGGILGDLAVPRLARLVGEGPLIPLGGLLSVAGIAA